MINITPLTWHWEEWLPMIRTRFEVLVAPARKAQDPIGMARAIGAWQQEVDAWLATFDEGRRRSCTDLLYAECDMLWVTIDPGHWKPTADDQTDFRQRWYEALPLALAAERAGFDRADIVVRAYRGLEQYAAEKQWLP